MTELASAARRWGAWMQDDRRVWPGGLPVAAVQRTRIGPLAPPGQRRHRQRTGGDGQLRELLQVLRIHGGAQSQAHQYGTLTGPWALEH